MFFSFQINKTPILECTFKTEDLIEESEYEFRIIAENKVGPGPPSSPSPPIKAKDPFGK